MFLELTIDRSQPFKKLFHLEHVISVQPNGSKAGSLITTTEQGFDNDPGGGGGSESYQVLETYDQVRALIGNQTYISSAADLVPESTEGAAPTVAP